MITVTTTRANVDMNVFVEQKTYRFLGFVYLRTFKNIVHRNMYFTLQGFIDVIRKKEAEKEVTEKH